MEKKKRNIFIACLLLLILCITVIVIVCTSRDSETPKKKNKETEAIYNKEETLTANDNVTDNNHEIKEDESNRIEAENPTADQVIDQQPEKDAISNSKKNTESKQHIHKWEKKTIMKHHDAVLIKEAWTEEVPVYEDVAIPVCSICKQDIIDETPAVHGKTHALAGEGSGHYTDYRKVQVGTETIQHDAEYSEAWDEPVEIEICECGATK